MQTELQLRKGVELIRISEVYSSLQGEGLLTGTPSIFVRTSGCNLRCWFCDTKFASWAPEGEHLSIDQIVDMVAKHQPRHVVLTGGEPMIYKSLPHLTSRLKAIGLHITIETAGTIFRPVDCDLMSISPKLSSSAPPVGSGTWETLHDARRERMQVVRELMRYDYQLKFVIDSPADTVELLDYLKRLGSFDPARVLLMPQGVDAASLQATEAWLRPWGDSQGFRYSPRAHIAWFGNRRGT